MRLVCTAAPRGESQRRVSGPNKGPLERDQRDPDAFWSCLDNSKMTADKKQGPDRLQLDRVLFLLLNLGTINHSHTCEDRMVPGTGWECTWTLCPAPDGQASDGRLGQSFHLQRAQHPSPRAARHHSSSNLLASLFPGQTSPCHPSLQPPGGSGSLPVSAP